MQAEYRLEIEIDGNERELLFVPADENSWYCKNMANGQVVRVGGSGVMDFLTRPAEKFWTLHCIAQMERIWRK